MSYLNQFGYKYHAGANVVIGINDKAVLEAVGISYNVIDSATPIYGYSSRLFDAVAPGQKLIQGSFVVNYTSPNYVFAMAQQGALEDRRLVAEQVATSIKNDTEAVKKVTDVAKSRAEYLKAVRKGNEDALRESETLKEHFWGDGGVNDGSQNMVAYDPTLIGPSRIQIFFGGPTRETARHLIEIHGVYIIGHGSAIQADENVILEEYNFIGRELIQAAFARG